MNRDDIIRMAREAGLCDEDGRDSDSVIIAKHLEQFANLVAAAERERIKWDTIHSCHPECDKPVCVAIRAAVTEEREACALEVEKAGMEGYGTLAAAAAIRARGQNGL